MPPTAPRPLHEPIVLLTGFDAFGGDAVNPSWILAQALHGRTLAGHRIVSGQLPTVFGTALEVLDDLLVRHRPALVVSLGLAGGRSALSLERVAINANDARIPDNRGAQPVDTPVVADGPAAYFSSLPIKAMLAALRREGIPAEVSQSAGTFVCNHVFYGLMHAIQRGRTGASTRGGFIHVPWLMGQGTPSMPLAQAVQGLRIALHCALTTTGDTRLAAGTEH